MDERLLAPHSLRLRAARPEDAPALAAMHARCSMDTVFRRYLCAVPAVSRAWQAHLLSTTVALVAVDERGLHALGNVVGLHDGRSAEVGLLVEDRFQGCGVGTAIAGHLAEAARVAGYRRLTADLLASSAAAQRVLTSLGRATARAHDGLVTYTVRLPLGRAAA